MTFYQYSGAGNTFLLTFEQVYKEQASFFCKKQDCDGLIFLQKKEKQCYTLTIYNKDGSIASMCGNGLRCVAQFLFEQNEGDNFQLETLDGLYVAIVDTQGVKTFFSSPRKIDLNLELELFEKKRVHFLFVGVPHLIIFDPRPDVDLHGRGWRNHPFFAPDGVNVNFITDFSQNSLSVRTYERGVEGETLACGTGSVASALALSLLHNVFSPILVKVASQETLRVEFTREKNNFSNITLQGPAKFISKHYLKFDESRMLAYNGSRL